MQWLWKGPLNGGITQSLIQKYLTNPYTFVLYYGLGLEEPEEYNQNLLWGNVMHKGLEIGLASPKPIKEQIDTLRPELIEESKKWPYINTTTVPSVLEMLKLYNDSYKQKFLLPGKEESNFSEVVDYIENVVETPTKFIVKDSNYACVTERQFKIPHTTSGGNTISLMGKVDGLAWDYSSDTPVLTLIEHKCKGSYDKVLFRAEISYDLQLNIYCKANEVYKVVYDNILIPETQWNCPPRDMMERHEFYIQRLYHRQNYGSYPVAKKPFLWLDQLSYTMDKNSIDNYFQETVDPICDQICELYDYCSQPSFDPLNRLCFNKTFFKRPLRLFDPAKTDKFKTSYWNFLAGQLPFEGLKPTQELFKELKGEG